MQLSVSGVGLSYDGRPVLNDVSFTLEERERTLLLGPSGSGKSSLLNIICGLQSPDAGEVTLGGQTIVSGGSQLNADSVRKQHMGIIF